MTEAGNRKKEEAKKKRKKKKEKDKKEGKKNEKEEKEKKENENKEGKEKEGRRRREEKQEKMFGLTRWFCVGDRFYLCENKILCEYDYEERMVFANMAYNPNTIAQLKRHASHLPVRETLFALFIETKILTTYD
ncbi:hypothetical protein M8J76_000546 [Diaphorina citri]|nr:hypothetical protein M8J76_000546 [Diaphorina citri]